MNKCNQLFARYTIAKEFMTKTQATIEIEGSDKPALIADWLGITYLA